MTEQENRLYAVNLMNRADVAFDVRDIAVVGKLIELIEGDVADWLSARLRGTVSREQIVAAVRAGTHRPELPPVKPAAASLEGNVK
ncbi:MAG: hypothetical protein WC803_08945 [Sphingomonas sp.]|jgi:hypothetical protein